VAAAISFDLAFLFLPIAHWWWAVSSQYLCTSGFPDMHNRDNHGTGVDSGRNLDFRLEKEPESIF